jgi:hypothetical protein
MLAGKYTSKGQTFRYCDYKTTKARNPNAKPRQKIGQQIYNTIKEESNNIQTNIEG